MRTAFTLLIAVLLTLNACSKSDDAKQTQDPKVNTTNESVQKAPVEKATKTEPPPPTKKSRTPRARGQNFFP